MSTAARGVSAGWSRTAGVAGLNIVFTATSVMWAWWGVDLLSGGRAPATFEQRTPDPSQMDPHLRPASAR